MLEEMKAEIQMKALKYQQVDLEFRFIFSYCLWIQTHHTNYFTFLVFICR